MFFTILRPTLSSGFAFDTTEYRPLFIWRWAAFRAFVVSDQHHQRFEMLPLDLVLVAYLAADATTCYSGLDGRVWVMRHHFSVQGIPLPRSSMTWTGVTGYLCTGLVKR